MTRTSDVNQLMRRAQLDGLKVTRDGDRWVVTNPSLGQSVKVPPKLTGRGLRNQRAQLRRLATPPAPMVAATGNTTDEGETAVSWPIADLLAVAEKQGVRVDVRGGVVHTTGPLDAEPVARMVRDRADEVIAHLNPPKKQEADLPKIRDVARIDIPSSDVAADAKAVWGLLRERARQAGDEQGINAGVPGVMWHGARDGVVRAAFPGWTANHRRDVSAFLESTLAMKCQSPRGRTPVWWIRDRWDDGGLTVSKTAGSGPRPKPSPPHSAPKSAPSTPAPVVQSADDPLSVLQAVAKRVQDAEQRAEEAELLVVALEEENERLRAERNESRAQVEQITNAFRVLAGGPQ